MLVSSGSSDAKKTWPCPQECDGGPGILPGAAHGESWRPYWPSRRGRTDGYTGAEPAGQWQLAPQLSKPVQGGHRFDQLAAFLPASIVLPGPRPLDPEEYGQAVRAGTDHLPDTDGPRSALDASVLIGMSEAQSWQQVWTSRSSRLGHRTDLAGLLEADGYDSPQGRVAADAWQRWARLWAGRLGLGPGRSAFEVGCGSGAFLYVLNQIGVEVSGLDLAGGLVDMARAAVPDGRFFTCDALGTPVHPKVDVCLAVSVFFYFPSLDYAARVAGRMTDKACSAVALLDLPDLATRRASEQYRIELAGGRQAYEERYGSLPHLYFDRDRTAELLESYGLVDVRCEDQNLPGYGNSPFRFNCWGYKPGGA